MHAVICAHTYEIGAHFWICFFESRYILRVQLRRMIRRIEAGCYRADHGVAHSRQIVVVGDVAWSDELNSRFVETRVTKLLGKGGRLPRRDEDKKRVWMSIGCALEEWCKVRVCQGNFYCFNNLATGFGKILAEDAGGLGTGSPVGRDDRHTFGSILSGPISKNTGLLSVCPACPHEIVRTSDYERRPRYHNDGGLLCLGHKRRDCKDIGSKTAPNEIDLIVDDHFLSDALGNVRDTGVVLYNQLHLATGNCVPVQRHV